MINFDIMKSYSQFLAFVCVLIKAERQFNNTKLRIKLSLDNTDTL